MPNQTTRDSGERLGRLEERVDEIKNNHLNNISKDIKDLRDEIQEMKTNQARWIGGGAVLIFLSQMLFAYILSRH